MGFQCVIREYKHSLTGKEKKNICQIFITRNGGQPIKYSKDPMKIRFESDDNLPLGQTVNILYMIIVITSVLKKMLNIIHEFVDMNEL